VGRYLDRYSGRISRVVAENVRSTASGGIDKVVPGGKEIFRINNFLPSIGGGPGFQLSAKHYVNLRADFARGAKIVGPGAWEWERHFDAERP
jgi:hypothetical protein